MNKPHCGRASKTIKALIQGTNPLTGDPLPTDNILNHADVPRAMLVAASSVEGVGPRANRRAHGLDSQVERQRFEINGVDRIPALGCEILPGLRIDHAATVSHSQRLPPIESRSG